MSGSDDSGDSKADTRQDSSHEAGTASSQSPDVTPATYTELLAQAKQFLQDDQIKSTSREKQVAFLENKGIKAEDIDNLLNGGAGDGNDSNIELRTVHDSTAESLSKRTQDNAVLAAPGPETNQVVSRDAPPIITYPEFLLKPQKPPPLVTFERLLYAAYGLAGLSTLTYSASKYIMQPMLAELTDARHTFASSTLELLEKLNLRLESTVSHVPYSATLAALKAKHDQDEDIESIDSDPTELFHRDIATQTSPRLSRSSSSDSLRQKKSLDVTNDQVSRLTSLHETLEELVTSVDPTGEPYLPPTSTKQLHDTVGQLQAMLDKLETTYNPFRSDYSSAYSSLSATNANSGRADNNEAAKFKAEIRSLKGAFLSSRNFPAARPSTFTGTGAR